MSHRITTKTEITDKDLATKALDKQEWGYEITGETILITSGPMAQARVNVATGVVEADSDHVRRDALNGLNQPYGECLCEQEAAEQGSYIESREVLSNGDIRLVINSSPA